MPVVMMVSTAVPAGLAQESEFAEFVARASAVCTTEPMCVNSVSTYVCMYLCVYVCEYE